MHHAQYVAARKTWPINVSSQAKRKPDSAADFPLSLADADVERQQTHGWLMALIDRRARLLGRGFFRSSLRSSQQASSGFYSPINHHRIKPPQSCYAEHRHTSNQRPTEYTPAVRAGSSARTHLFPVVKNEDFAVLVVNRHRALVPLACRNISTVKTCLQLHTKQLLSI